MICTYLLCTAEVFIDTTAKNCKRQLINITCAYDLFKHSTKYQDVVCCCDSTVYFPKFQDKFHDTVLI